MQDRGGSCAHGADQLVGRPVVRHPVRRAVPKTCQCGTREPRRRCASLSPSFRSPPKPPVAPRSVWSANVTRMCPSDLCSTIADFPPPIRTTAMSTCQSSDEPRLDTAHGGCTSTQSWPSTMHRPRLIWADRRRGDRAPVEHEAARPRRRPSRPARRRRCTRPRPGRTWSGGAWRHHARRRVSRIRTWALRHHAEACSYQAPSCRSRKTTVLRPPATSTSQ